MRTARTSKVVDTIGAIAAKGQLSDWLRDEFDSLSDSARTPVGAPLIAQRRLSIRIGNINLRENAAGEIVIENSLHRFFHGHNGHNGGNFTRADVAAAITKMSDTLGFDVSGCRLTKLAFGANLTGLNVQASLQALTDYKGKAFTMYERGNGITGAKRVLTELDLKFYDKRRELSEKGLGRIAPTLRYELTSRKQSYLRRLGVATVADLATSAFFETAGEELTGRLTHCNFMEQLDTALLTADEMEALALVASSYWPAYAADRKNRDRTARRRKLVDSARKKATTHIKAGLLSRVNTTLADLS